MTDDGSVALKSPTPDPAQPPPARARSSALRIARLRDLALIPAILLIGAIGVYVSPVFLTRENLTHVLQQQSEISLVVLGEALILIVGRLDLSLESTVGLAPGVACWLILPKSPYHGAGTLLNGGWAIPIALAVGILVGLLNGLLIVRFQLHGFIVTLGMLITLRGLLNGVSQGQTFFGLPKSMTYLGSGTTEWLGLPASVWTSLLLFAIGIAVLGFTRVGRSLYAIGGNAAAAKAAGIRVDRVVWMTFIVASTLAAFAGILLAGHSGSVAEQSGNGWIFQVFAGCVIGGVSMNGGRGTIFGAFTGILLLFVVQNVLTLENVGANWIQFLDGVVILAALIIARLVSGQAQAT